MIALERRLEPSNAMLTLSPLAAIVLSVLTAAIGFAALGRSPAEGLFVFFLSPLGSWYGLSELAVKITPLLLCAAGLVLCFRAKVWNIGAEGQYLCGALIGGWLALSIAEATGAWVLPLVLLVGALGGLVWSALAALLKTRFGANEILTTIMLNYVALNLLLWAVHGPLKDPSGYNFPESALFSEAATLPTLVDGYRANVTLLIALAAIVALWTVLARTLFGFELRVLGASPAAARFAGFDAAKITWIVLAVSGALAGLAGVAEVAGPIGQLVPQISVGYGYAAIIAVFLGRMRPLGIVAACALLGLTFVGGEAVQIDLNLPRALTALFQGLLLFYLLACDLAITHRIKRI